MSVAATTIGRGGGVPGNKAIWVGIFAELTEFALMFLVYFVASAHYPEAFRAGAEKLSTLALKWLMGALATGCGYPVVKVFELRWNLSQGLDGGGDPFQLAYYYLTFNHLVHVSWGLLGMAWVIVRVRMGGYTASAHDGLVAFASYWHATDLIWLMIFPLFYVLR